MYYSSYSLLGALVLVANIFAIASVIGGRSSTERKILWTAIILLLPVVGMVLYYAIGRTSSDVTVT